MNAVLTARNVTPLPKSISSALSALKAACALRAQTPILTTVLMKSNGVNLTLESTDLESLARYTTKMPTAGDPFAMAIPFDEFSSMVKHASVIQLLNYDDTHATFSIDGATRSIMILRADEWPAWIQRFKCEQPTATFRGVFDAVLGPLKQVSSMASHREASGQVLMSTFLEVEHNSVVATATDGFALRQARIATCASGITSAIVPPAFTSVLAALPFPKKNPPVLNVGIYPQHTYATVTLGDGSRWEVFTRLVTGGGIFSPADPQFDAPKWGVLGGPHETQTPNARTDRRGPAAARGWNPRC